MKTIGNLAELVLLLVIVATACAVVVVLPALVYFAIWRVFS